MTTRYLVVCKDYPSEHATEGAALRQLEAMQLEQTCSHPHYVTSFDDTRACATDGPHGHTDGMCNLDDDEDFGEPLVDSGGYLRCGCHGSQRDHTCGPQD